MITKDNFKVHIGDTRAVLKTLSTASVHTCVTSPPYFGLRDYGLDGQIGLEETPEQFITQLVDVFREVKRVLRDDGTLWVNIGDTYATGSGGSGTTSAKQQSNQGTNFAPRKALRTGDLKSKDLIGIPWMLAFALRADGWYLRSEIIWAKPNPMTESVIDRPTKAHEQIFLLSKSKSYFYDADAIKEQSIINHLETRNKRTVWTIAPKSEGLHFAVFPPELPLTCILAGTSAYGVCKLCGDPWDKDGRSCDHLDYPSIPATVLDPFSGSGTTGIVANANDRAYVGVELNPEYAAISLQKYETLLPTLRTDAHSSDRLAELFS